MIITLKYVNTYRVLGCLDETTGKISANKDDTYIQGKYKTQIYRWDNNTLCIYFPSGVSSTNKVIPQFDELGIKYSLFHDCDGESVYKVDESDIHKIHSILQFLTKGKSISPFSVKTARKQVKKLAK